MRAIKWPGRRARSRSRPAAAVWVALAAATTAAPAARAFTGAASASAGYSVVPSPNAFSGWNALHGVSASSATDAWAVGYLCCRPGYFGFGTLTEHWNGTAWSIVPSQDLFRFDDVLNGVADLSATTAWAVGYIRAFSSSIPAPLIIHWNGASWQGGGTPTGLSGTLRAVSADSLRDVWAVGDDGHGRATALRYNGTAWSSVALPAAGASDMLQGVKAFGPSDVWAVGDQLPSSASAVTHTLVLHWNGNAWSVVPSPSPDPNSDILHAVGGVAGNDLWAVGQQGQDETGTGVPPGTRTLAEHWNGTSWSVMTSPNVGDQDTLNAVAATAPGSVAAAGSDQNRSGPVPVDRTLAQQWNGTGWATQPTPNVGSTDNLLEGAAAVPGTSTVWAVGVRMAATRLPLEQTLILRAG